MVSSRRPFRIPLSLLTLSMTSSGLSGDFNSSMGSGGFGLKNVSSQIKTAITYTTPGRYVNRNLNLVPNSELVAVKLRWTLRR